MNFNFLNKPPDSNSNTTGSGEKPLTPFSLPSSSSFTTNTSSSIATTGSGTPSSAGENKPLFSGFSVQSTNTGSGGSSAPGSVTEGIKWPDLNGGGSKPTFTFPSISSTTASKFSLQTSSSSATPGFLSANPNVEGEKEKSKDNSSTGFGGFNFSFPTPVASTSGSSTLNSTSTIPTGTEKPLESITPNPFASMSKTTETSFSLGSQSKPSAFDLSSVFKATTSDKTGTQGAEKSVSFQPLVTNIPSSGGTAFQTPLKGSITPSIAETPVTASLTASTPASNNIGISPGPLTLSALKAEPSKSLVGDTSLSKSSLIVPTTTTTTTASTSTIQNRTLEEIINKWSRELESHIKAFRGQALEISSFDTLLISQGQKIAELHDKVVHAECLQNELDANLDFLDKQQVELDGLLGILELDVNKIVGGPLSDLLASDYERENMYRLAESVGQNIYECSEGLQELVSQINTAVESVNTTDSVSVELVKLLNQHWNTLMWADEMSLGLKEKLNELVKMKRNIATDKSRLVGK